MGGSIAYSVQRITLRILTGSHSQAFVIATKASTVITPTIPVALEVIAICVQLRHMDVRRLAVGTFPTGGASARATWNVSLRCTTVAAERATKTRRTSNCRSFQNSIHRFIGVGHPRLQFARQSNIRNATLAHPLARARIWRALIQSVIIQIRTVCKRFRWCVHTSATRTLVCFEMGSGT